MKVATLLATVCMTVSSLALAQEAIAQHAQAASPATAATPTSNAVLRTGTEVPLKLREAITTKKKAAKVGQRFHLVVADDVKVDGRVVIPIGSPAIGEITDVRNKGMWGKSGHLAAQLLYVEVNGRQIRLSGTFDEKGATGTVGVVAAVALVPIVGFFTTGTSAELPLGSPVKGFIAEDVPLSFAAGTVEALRINSTTESRGAVQPTAILGSK